MTLAITLSTIDVVSDEVYLNGVPHDQFALLRRHAPVFRQRVPDPELVDEVWVVSTAELVQEVSSHPELYSSQREGIHLGARRLEEGMRVAAGNFIALDGSEHRRLRTMVSAAFTPRVVRTFTEHYATLTDRVLDAALRSREFDLVTDIAAELPLLAICELLGAPDEDRADILSWSNAVLGVNDPEYAGGPADAGRAVSSLGSYALRLAEAKRAAPGDDLVSQLANAAPQDRLTDPELEGFVLLLLVAGSETTRNTIAHGVLALMENPDQWDALRADPGLLDGAVEEITRWASPVNYMARTATCDVELGGQRIAEGDRVAMFYGSANRDEALFPDGHRFDITHGYRRHLAFGFGRHFCLGAHLARIETRAVFAGLLARGVRLEQAGPVARLRSSFLNSLKHLPVAVRH